MQASFSQSEEVFYRSHITNYVFTVFLSKNVSSALEWGLPYPKFSFMEVYHRIYFKITITFLLTCHSETKFPPYRESQPQNHEFRNNPENFHPCVLGKFEPQESVRYYVYYNIGLVANA